MLPKDRLREYPLDVQKLSIPGVEFGFVFTNAEREHVIINSCHAKTQTYWCDTLIITPLFIRNGRKSSQNWAPILFRNRASQELRNMTPYVLQNSHGSFLLLFSNFIPFHFLLILFTTFLMRLQTHAMVIIKIDTLTGHWHAVQPSIYLKQSQRLASLYKVKQLNIEV